MSKAKHTPLPWTCYWREIDDGGQIEADCGVYHEPTPGHAYSVCRAPRYAKKEEWEANGEFIVRACNAHDDLLAAINEAEVALRDLADFYVGNIDHNPSFAAGIELVRRAVRAAIAKAEG